jgi:hypothetical protein
VKQSGSAFSERPRIGAGTGERRHEDACGLVERSRQKAVERHQCRRS